MEADESEPLLQKKHPSTSPSIGSSIQQSTFSPDNLSESSSYRKKRYRLDNFLPCDPRRWMHRFLMLGLMCMLSFGKYCI